MTPPLPLDDNLLAVSSHLPKGTADTNIPELPLDLPDAGDRFLSLDESEQRRLVRADYDVAYRLLESGGLDSYNGEWVAAVRGAVIGHGKKALALRYELAAKHNVHPERIAMIYVEDLRCPSL